MSAKTWLSASKVTPTRALPSAFSPAAFSILATARVRASRSPARRPGRPATARAATSRAVASSAARRSGCATSSTLCHQIRSPSVSMSSRSPPRKLVPHIGSTLRSPMSSRSLMPKARATSATSAPGRSRR